MTLEAPLTQLLKEWRAGDANALEQITPLVYETLRQIGTRFLGRERAGITLQATDVVHEAFLRLVGVDVDWQDRAHFFAVAARSMRRILVDHARAKFSDKRGGNFLRIPIEEQLGLKAPSNELLLEFDRALTKLAEIDERKSAVLEHHVFGGLSYDECAAVLNVSPATVDRDLRFAKAWVYREIAGDEA